LLDSGFVSGCHYNMTTQEGEITLTLSNTGDRLVSKKEKSGAAIPVLDINTNSILEAFPQEMIGQKLYTRFYEGKIVITVTHEALGNGVVANGFIALSELIGEQALKPSTLETDSMDAANSFAARIFPPTDNQLDLFA